MSDALDFYASVFRDMRIVTRNPMMATFEIPGQRLHALNAPSKHQFTEAISLFIDCETQNEVHYYC
jgi:predicted 3-demethylubiquinone-9 3-methyltransferase (glyoxalase superfamily)